MVKGATHRVKRVDERLGGKGVNVASVLAQLGIPVIATGLMHDGPAGFHPIAGRTRRTVVVTDGQDATGFWEPGPAIAREEWEGFKAHFAGLTRQAEVVVLSGSLPQNLPQTAYRELIEACHVPSILDTSGDALREGMTAGPAVVKPNAAELKDLGRTHPNTTVVASDGPEGLCAKGIRARPPWPVAGNPTGAGDACVAALAKGLLNKASWPEMLRDAVALSAAAVASPIAGLVDPELYQALLPQIVMEEA
jgi:tagatose 6-phosphate kinase